MWTIDEPNTCSCGLVSIINKDHVYDVTTTTKPITTLLSSSLNSTETTNKINSEDKMDALEIINGVGRGQDIELVPVTMPGAIPGETSSSSQPLVLDNYTWKFDSIQSALELGKNLSNISHVLSV